MCASRARGKLPQWTGAYDLLRLSTSAANLRSPAASTACPWSVPPESRRCTARLRRSQKKLVGSLKRPLWAEVRMATSLPASEFPHSMAWAVLELSFDDWASMESACASPHGAASDVDLPAFADLTRTTWSAVDEIICLQ